MIKFVNMLKKNKIKVGTKKSNLTEEEESILEGNLVWIFADRRSGTTWLGQELLSYKTKYVDEPLIGLHLAYPQVFKEIVKAPYEFQKKRDDYFFSDNYKDTWMIYLRKLILNRINAQIQDLSTKIILKEPSGSLAAEIIAECLPRSKIIVILRDGRDVLDSKIDALRKGGWATQNEGGFSSMEKENRMLFIKTRSRYWVKLVEILMRAFEKHQNDLKLLIHYEKLREDTVSQVKKIYEFLGIDIPEDTLSDIVNKFSFENLPENEKGSGKFRRFAQPGLWRDNFNEDEKQIIKEIMNETLKKIGYE